MEEGLAKFLGVDDATANEMRSEWAALNIEWHCPGRHGVVRDVPADRAGYVQRVIEWHVGSRACRWTGTVDGKRSVEFVHMTKVFPPPRKPWEWCGTTVLFTDWQDAEHAAVEAGAKFSPGDAVFFAARGTIKQGLVVRVNRKSVTVTVEGDGNWNVPPTDLGKINKES